MIPGSPERAELLKTAAHGRSLWDDARRRLLSNKAAVTSMIVLALLIVLAIVGPSLVPFQYDEIRKADVWMGAPGVLSVVGRTLLQACRRQDVVIRWGGEEFVIGLPGTDAAAAELIVKRLADLLVAGQSDRQLNRPDRRPELRKGTFGDGGVGGAGNQLFPAGATVPFRIGLDGDVEHHAFVPS